VPFDYGRIEFRVDLATGELNFIEINLNCNLWSEKVMAKAAAQAGFSHAELLETILAEAWLRNGLMSPVASYASQRVQAGTLSRARYG
jgi:D-alanine-D-alanine ligase